MKDTNAELIQELMNEIELRKEYEAILKEQNSSFKQQIADLKSMQENEEYLKKEIAELKQLVMGIANKETTISLQPSINATKELDKDNQKSIKFGTYKMGKNGEVESIEWLVLDKQDGKALLLSKDILDCKKYNEKKLLTWAELLNKDTLEGMKNNESKKDITWANCGLNQWLNNDFYNEAFSEEDKKVIIQTSVETSENPKYGTDGGDISEDYVFCLSIQEIEQYFGLEHRYDSYFWSTEKEEARAKGSEYVKNKTNLYVDANNKKSYWWTRSQGEKLFSRAAYVSERGDVVMAGYDVNNINYVGVRPALWVKIKS